MEAARDHLQKLCEVSRGLVLDALNPPEHAPARKRSKATGHDDTEELMAHVARCKPPAMPVLLAKLAAGRWYPICAPAVDGGGCRLAMASLKWF